MIELNANSDTWTLLNRIFTGDTAPLTKSQYLDKITSDKTHSPEIQLWWDILKITCEDWTNYKDCPTVENFKLIKDIDSWAFKDSFAINRICDMIYLAFKIEPDMFKTKFRQWLERERYIAPSTFTTYQIDSPFIDLSEDPILHDTPNQS